ncbi:MAG: hypothetical protein ACRDK3_02980 [Actinomycetota bacterium]
MRTRAAPLAAALLFAILVSLAACSGSPRKTVRAATAKTTDAGSAHVVITGSTTSGGQSFTVTGEGDFDFEKLVGAGTFDLSDLPVAAGGTLGDEGVGELIFDGSTFYMNLPFLSRLSPDIEDWVRFDTAELGGRSNQIAQLGQNDPSQALSYLNGATEITKRADEDVAGVSTTRYDLTIDYREGFQEAPEGLRPAYDSIIDDLDIEEAPGSVWIDEQGFIRRMSYEWTFEPGSATGETTQNVALEFSDYGDRVEVELPPEDEVTDFEELLRRGP